MTLATLGRHPMQLQFSALSHPGVVRQYDEDACHADSQGQFFIIADSMGGYSSGEQASRFTVDIPALYLESYGEQAQALPEVMQRIIVRVNERLLEEQEQNPVIKNIGTTVIPPYRMQGNDSAVQHSKTLVADGANNILEISGQSTRPSAEIIPVVADAIWRGYGFVS